MFDNPQEVDSLTYQMRLADWIRGQNRARINALFNGVPPYTNQEVEENNITVNVNYLEGLGLSHDARAQFSQAYMKPGNFFGAVTDYGPVHKRDSYGRIATKGVNRIMKKSLPYFECLRSKFASNILHGIGPSVFRNRERWCPQMLGVEDVMVPAQTHLTLENLPFIAFYRSYTGRELRKLAKGPDPDAAWNQPLVDACLSWIDENTPSLFSSNWPELWSPEKAGERLKGDGCLYSGDAAPQINCWDFYFWDDSKKTQSWKRRMIVDTWTSPEVPNGGMRKKKGKLFDSARNNFLYNPKDRAYASELSEIVNFQFADLSAVAPFRYHTVRSLGFMLYALCHLQNRMRCRFNEAVFEGLLQYFRVAGADDVQRALKTELINRGFIDDSVRFVKTDERWNPNADLAQMGLAENARLIQKHASSFVANPMTPQAEQTEKTKFQVMTEVQAVTQLVSAALQQTYAYQVYEYREIFRRFMMKDSKDPEVRMFQANALRQGLPEKLLCVDYWEIDPERVVGAGNKTLELAITQQLMEYRNLYDPSSQRIILRDATASITDDAAKAELLVPDQPQISDSTHDAQLALGTLMLGLPVAVKSGINHVEYIEALLTGMAILIKTIQQSGNTGSPEKVTGLKNVANHVVQHINIVAQNPQEKARVKEYGDTLGQMMNLVKGFEQRVNEKRQAAQQQNGGDPEAAAKLRTQEMLAQAKTANTRDAHSQRTAQRQIQFEMQQEQKEKEFQQKLRQQQQEHQLQMQQEQQEHQLALAEGAATTAAELQQGARKSEQEVQAAERKARASAKKTSGQD